MQFIKYTAIVTGVLCIVAVFVVYIGAHYPGSRSLTEAEKELAYSIYGDHIRLDAVRIASDSVYSVDVSKTIGNVVHIRTADYRSRARADLSYQALLVHELGHVWQYQNQGWGYIPESLAVQFVAFLRTGSRSAAYSWEADFLKGTPWGDLNPEQQAESVAEYFYFSKLSDETNADQQELKKELECFIPFLRDGCTDRQN